MAEAVSGIASVVETLNQRICELEQRVTELEQRAESGRVRRAKVVASEATNWPPKYTTPPPATWRGFPPVDTPAGAASSTGRRFLDWPERSCFVPSLSRDHSPSCRWSYWGYFMRSF